MIVMKHMKVMMMNIVQKKIIDMGKLTKYEKLMRQDRARMDLSIAIQRVLMEFESKEEPGYEYSELDIINVLSKIVCNKTPIGN